MMDHILAVQRMQDYLSDHCQEQVTMADLCKASLFSPWYSYRLFQRHTGLTPADYLRRLRLSRSAVKLRDEGVQIAQIAFELGFLSVDGYQRAFLRAFGCNPREYAASPRPIKLFIPYGVKYRELRKEPDEVEKVRTVFVQRVERPNRKVILKRGAKADSYFSYCEEVGCDVWGILASIPSVCGEPVSLWLPEKYRSQGTSEYVQGVEVAPDYAGAVPDGFDVIALDKASYLMFQGEPFREEDYCQAIIEVQRAIEGFDPARLKLAWDPCSPRIQLEPVGERGYIELWPVRPALV